MADGLMYLNMLGIGYLLIHTIFMRKNLVKMAAELDHKEVTPSDFALLVRNIPKDMTKEKLKELLEDRFSRGAVKVSYINLCYDITDMVKLNTNITDLIKQKGAYKLHLKKEMKAQGLTKKQIVSNPSAIEPPTYKLGVMKKKTLNLREIESEIKSTQDKIQEYSKKLEPGSEAGLFIGVAVVVVTQ